MLSPIRSAHTAPLSAYANASASALDGLPEAARLAWRRTVFAGLSADVTRAMLARSSMITVRASEIAYRASANEESPLLGIVVSGLLRFYIQAPDGRAMTVRYAGPGEIVGARGVALVNPSGADALRRDKFALTAEALHDATILQLHTRTVATAARTHPELAWALAGEVSNQAMRDQELITTNVFCSIRNRVARHMLMLATKRGDELVLDMTHQGIADAIGSVREVVSRALCRLQDEGIVQRRGRTLTIRNPMALYRVSTE